MAKRITVVTCAILLALAPICVFAGAQKEAATGAVAEGKPQYGGTLTFFWPVLNQDPPSPDIKDGAFHQTQYLNPIQEQPLVGDFVNKGPRGSGEYDFQLFSYIPNEYLTGWLLESWEMQADKIIWKVRPGIYWAADNVDWMDNREFVAEDLVADILDFKEAPAGGILRDKTGNIYATDKYTLVIEMTSFDHLIPYRIGYEDRAGVSPPEMQKAGPKEWKNQVGTGAYMFDEYSVGAYMRFKKNPNWWQKATIEGEEYDLPFIETLVLPIIPDVATQVASLRTGKLDVVGGEGAVAPQYWESLDKTEGLQSKKTAAGIGSVLVFKTNEPPFDNKDVRRAMMVATDLKAFADLQGVGPLPKHWYPVPEGTVGAHIPFDQLPDDIKVLYDYNPERAKQMLADAGYPNGFAIEHWVTTTPASQDSAALLKNMWAKVGVEVNIKPMDEVIRTQALRAATYVNLTTDGPKVGNPILFPYVHGRTGDWFNCSQWSNAEFDALADQLMQYIPVQEQNRLVKEMTVVMLREVPYLPTNMVITGHYWWPWIRNYYGERAVNDSGQPLPLMGHAWIDQNMKKSMGY
jgi:peptide/nickel transport system substrate-binding protein